MKINQRLTKEDFYNLNLYLYKKNSKFKMNILVIAIVSIIGAALSFYDKKIGIGIFFAVVAIVGVIAIPFIYKALIKKTVNKNMKEEYWDICVELNNDSIYYTFTTEDKSNIDPYIWGDIANVIEKEKYYYIQINVRTILVIKKECVENLNELEELLEKKLTSRFFPNKK